MPESQNVVAIHKLPLHFASCADKFCNLVIQFIQFIQEVNQGFAIFMHRGLLTQHFIHSINAFYQMHCIKIRMKYHYAKISR
jgi:hypothetical protein